eukprot:9333061-Pyramimonas_sp.AAC.1
MHPPHRFRHTPHTFRGPIGNSSEGLSGGAHAPAALSSAHPSHVSGCVQTLLGELHARMPQEPA